MAFPALAEGTQNGLRRLVADNSVTVASMLDVEKYSVVDALCEKCAQVIRQQQLSVASFLARFFSADLLSDQAIIVGKSGKGSAATLADRIAVAWAANKCLAKAKNEKTAIHDHEQEARTAEEEAEAPSNGEDDQKRKPEVEPDQKEARIPQKKQRKM